MPLMSRLRLPSRARRRRRRAASTREPAPLPRPVYIYPGVIKMSPRRAVALDAATPAALYTPSHCADSCAVCLEAFQPARDIIRRLPCGHVFHSRCILSWLCTADRCPLCNDPVLACTHARPIPLGCHGDKTPTPTPANGVACMPDVTPSTLCGPQVASDAVAEDEPGKVRFRVYSFMLHDQARFAQLLGRGK